MAIGWKAESRHNYHEIRGIGMEASGNAAAVRRYPFSVFSRFAALSDGHKRRQIVPKIKLPAQRPISGKKDTGLFADLINDCLGSPEGNRSEVDFRLCCEAVERGWLKESVWGECSNVGKFAERGREYFERTWAKAENHTRLKIYEEKAAKRSGKSADKSEHQSDANGNPQRSELYKSALERCQLEVLGRCGDGRIKVFSKFSHAVETIRDPDRYGYSMMLGIAGPPFRENVARYVDPESPTSQLDLKTLQEAIGETSCGNQYPEGNEKGAGCWPCIGDGGKPNIAIVGLKQACYWTGETIVERNHPIMHNLFLQFEHCEWEQWYNFKQLESEIRLAARQEYRAGVLSELIGLLCRWNWGHTSMPLTAAGVILASWIQTVWHWRPQILVSGETNSGKSSLFRMLSGIYGDMALVSSQSTAAGLRQTLETTAKIPLCDEFDVHNKSQKVEQDKILKMIRDSGRGGTTLRGTAHQRAKNFVLRHIFWMAGTNVHFEDATDQNRFIMLDLKPAASGKENKLAIPREPELRTLGMRLFASVLVTSSRAIELAETLVRNTPEVSQAHSRQIESYSVPAAVLAAVLGESDEAAANRLRVIMGPVSEQEDHQVKKDHETLLNDIFTAHIPPRGQPQKLVSQWLHDAVENNSTEAATMLEQYGIKAEWMTAKDASEIDGAAPGDRCLLIHPEIVRRDVLYGTQWHANGFKRAIQGIRSITCGRRRIGRGNTTTFIIDWRAIADRFDGDGERSGDADGMGF